MSTRDYYYKNLEAQREYNRAYHARTKERRAEVSKKSYQTNKDDICTQHRAYNQTVRLDVLTHYGGQCACCEEAQLEFLALDHTDGGGNKHRKELKKWGSAYYLWVKKNGYPEGYRVLCHNCNQSLGHYGYCPHDAQEVA